MGVTSTQGFAFKLVANGTQLDLFKDEEIFVSDNVTGLFDIGVLPAEFTRQITVPGTKKNNAFFEHSYDISIQNPFLFATNQKVPCYLDFDGIYLADGYLQLNKINIIANKFIDSYEITIYGGLSSFARDINRYYLTDLTGSLSQFNHTSSFDNISSSWNGDLFSGSIVYPLAEYGQKIQYTPEEPYFGIDANEGALCVQDFKPAIRIKEVWDAIFETYGYTYTGSFWQQSWLDNVYMICNNQLRYPVYEEYDLETYGLFKIAPLSGSGLSNVTMSVATDLQLPWFNIQSNPGDNISNDLVYTLDFKSRLRGELGLNFELKSTGVGNGVPVFYFKVKDANTLSTVSTTVLVKLNEYMLDIYAYNSTQTKTEKFQLITEFNTSDLPAGDYKFYLEYANYGGSNFQIILNPDNNLTNSYLEIKKVNQGGEGLVLDIPSNMPYGTSGIKQIDFITGIQKKFNLVIYPNKTKPREFICEEFNNWYRQGEIKDFNRFINLDKKIEAVPANNLAVNKLNFGDTLDGDYISQQFQKGNNREFGKQYYVDTENFFSQGEFNVKTTFASSPLTYLAGTGVSGSAATGLLQFQSIATAETNISYGAYAVANIKYGTQYITQADAQVYSPGSSLTVYDPPAGYALRQLSVGDVITFEANGGGTYFSYTFEKELDGVPTVIDNGGSPQTFDYIIEAADIAAGTCRFYCNVFGGD